MEQLAKPVYWTILVPLPHPWKPASPHRRCLHEQRVSILSVWASTTKHHRSDVLWTRGIYLSQFWRLEIWDQGAIMVRFWWGLSASLQTTDTSLDFCMVERTETELFETFCKVLIPFMRLHPCDPLSSQKPCLFIIITLCVRISTYEFGEQKCQSVPQGWYSF